MSDCWSDAQYDGVVDFVEGHLWQFVQANAAVHNPKQIVSNIAQLSADDLHFLVRLHFLLSSFVQDCINKSVPLLLRRLAQSSTQVTTELRGTMRGNVDWHQTMKRRLNGGLSDPTLYVTRLTVKAYDQPELQALKYLLSKVSTVCTDALEVGSRQHEQQSANAGMKWKEALVLLKAQANESLKYSGLRSVTLPPKITEVMLERVRTARNPHFKPVYRCLQLYRRLFLNEDREALQECVRATVLKPLNRDTLYEIYILFATMQSVQKAGWRSNELRLIGQGEGAVATYERDGALMRIYYQTLPKSFLQRSLYKEILHKYNLDIRSRRPDILFEFGTGEDDYTLLEIKRTEDSQYTLEGFYKALGYLKDFEKAFQTKRLPQAILVVWDGVKGTIALEDSLVILNHHDYATYAEQFLQTDKTNQD